MTASMSGQCMNSASVGPICSGARATWTAPVSNALRGIPSNSAVSAVWASTSPPASRTRTSPRDPSLPVPLKTTAIACRPRSRARLLKNRSIGSDRAWFGSRSVSSRRPPDRIISLPGGSR